MKEIHVLLVDDQALFRESLQVLLELDEEIKVIGLAEDGQDALDFCQHTLPHLVLMDLHMPVLNGVEATRVIKSRWPEVKVVILTTFNEIHHVIDALKAGAEGYVLKAIRSDDLRSGVKLVHRGGTLITQGMAKQLMDQIPNDQTKRIASIRESESSAHRSHYSLTTREREVLQALSMGLNNKEIAKKLFLSEGTVRNYISNIYSKLDVRDRVQATMKALDEELI